MALISEQGQLEQLLGRLNRRGMRERALLAALKRRQKLLADTLTGGPPSIITDALRPAHGCAQQWLLHLQRGHIF